MSKGSKQRACLISREEYDKNWDKVFKKNKKNVESSIQEELEELESRIINKDEG